MGVIVEYDSNNSGGDWWLKDEDWDALAEAGWNVYWKQGSGFPSLDPNAKHLGPLDPREKTGQRWLGALATSAAKEFENPADAIPEWERITGQDAGAIGCNCCGTPHSFSYTDADGGYHYASPREPESAPVEWS
jgi:hypothetical protein